MPTKAELQVRVDELEKENASLKKMLSRAERELSGKLLPEELPPADIPDRVSWWMKYFRAPWEAFWCYHHRRWCD
ncbi:antitoxin PHD, partial [Escherichia coli]|nr:antitoxin PHD [Escherichia coli]